MRTTESRLLPPESNPIIVRLHCVAQPGRRPPLKGDHFWVGRGTQEADDDFEQCGAVRRVRPAKENRGNVHSFEQERLLATAFPPSGWPADGQVFRVGRPGRGKQSHARALSEYQPTILPTNNTKPAPSAPKQCVLFSGNGRPGTEPCLWADRSLCRSGAFPFSGEKAGAEQRGRVFPQVHRVRPNGRPRA